MLLLFICPHNILFIQFGSLSIVTCFLYFYIDILSNAFVLYALTFYVVPNCSMNQEWKFCILVLGYVVYISNFYLLDVNSHIFYFWWFWLLFSILLYILQYTDKLSCINENVLLKAFRICNIYSRSQFRKFRTIISVYIRSDNCI